MKQLSAVKVQLYPTKEQEIFLAKSFGCSRFIYNHFLAKKNEIYRETGKNFNYNECAKDLVSLKKQEEYSWLSDIYSQSLQAALRNLDSAFLRFFRGQSQFPKFKSKYGKQSFNIPQHFEVNSNSLKIPKIGHIKFRGNLYGNILKYNSITISKSKAGNYYAAILCEKEIEYLPVSDKEIGIDLGLTHFAITSDGEKFKKPKRKSIKKLKYIQRQHAKKKKGSKNKERQRIELAKVYEKESRILHDFQHKLSKTLINENQVIGLETLAVKNMMKNHKLARAIAESSWSCFVNKLEYKAKFYGRDIGRIDKWYPSSKTCSSCGHIHQSMKLSIRKFNCEACGEFHDRDINAAKNILIQAKSVLGINSDYKQKHGEALTGLDSNIDTRVGSMNHESFRFTN